MSDFVMMSNLMHTRPEKDISLSRCTSTYTSMIQTKTVTVLDRPSSTLTTPPKSTGHYQKLIFYFHSQLM